MINECTNNTMNISEGEDAKWCLEMQRLSTNPSKSHEVPKHKLPAKCMTRSKVPASATDFQSNRAVKFISLQILTRKNGIEIHGRQSRTTACRI